MQLAIIRLAWHKLQYIHTHMKESLHNEDVNTHTLISRNNGFKEKVGLKRQSFLVATQSDHLTKHLTFMYVTIPMPILYTVCMY